jgi:Domain of unknown function (DUF4082)
MKPFIASMLLACCSAFGQPYSHGDAAWSGYIKGGNAPAQMWVTSITPASIQGSEPYTLGCEFTVGAVNITVSALQMYNCTTANSGTHPIGIFTTSGTLLISGNCALASQPVGWVTATGLSPASVTLAANTTYFIGELENSGDVYAGSSTTIAVTGAATLTGSFYSPGSTLNYSSPQGDAGFFTWVGVSFTYH